jgi:hypothetical protein
VPQCPDLRKETHVFVSPSEAKVFRNAAQSAQHFARFRPP